MTGGSRLYTGVVRHERARPRLNRFAYGIYFLLLDLDEVGDLDQRLRRFSYGRPNWAALFAEDHGPRDGTPLRPWIESVLAGADIDLDGGRIFLLTFPRVWGFRFYPVSFWYCHHSDGTLRAVLAEVNNTFREHHSYLLHRGGEPLTPDDQPQADKILYVSPFIPMRARYTFALTEPDKKLSVGIRDDVPDGEALEDGRPLLLASIDLVAHPLTDANIARAVLRYGPMSLRAWVLILLNAAKLIAKRVRIVPKPSPPTEEVSS